MTDPVTLGAALLLGLVASGHCILMCGGITAALGIATAKRADGRPRPLLLAGYQVGRIASYTLAGLVFGGALGAVVDWLDIEAVRRALRALAALALLAGALVAFGSLRDPGSGLGRRLWPKLAPLGRRFLPVTTLPRAAGFGMVWGWMPCGIVYTMLAIAGLQLDAARSAATMAAFGLGTAPAWFATALGALRFLGFAARPAARRVAGTALLAAAALTFAGPWLAAYAPGFAHWLPFDCGAIAHTHR
ncbi:MAG: sulfite exporter TauE/SafE family protein [Steroidobacteraceae bacterium]